MLHFAFFSRFLAAQYIVRALCAPPSPSEWIRARGRSSCVRFTLRSDDTASSAAVRGTAPDCRMAAQRRHAQHDRPLGRYGPLRSRFMRNEDCFGSALAAVAPSRHARIGTCRPTCSRRRRWDGLQPRCAWSARRRVGRRTANLQRHRGQLQPQRGRGGEGTACK